MQKEDRKAKMRLCTVRNSHENDVMLSKIFNILEIPFMLPDKYDEHLKTEKHDFWRTTVLRHFRTLIANDVIIQQSYIEGRWDINHYTLYIL